MAQQPDRHDAMVLRARLEFPVWYRAFIKSYTAWTNAPSDLKGPMLLSGQGLARAETWLIEYPDKLTDSQKRYIVRSISQRAKQPQSTAAKPAEKPKKSGKWRRSSDRPLWQVFAVIAFGCWVFLPDMMGDLLERSLNSPEAYEISRRQQKLASAPPAPSPSTTLASPDQVAEAEAPPAELPPLLQDTPPRPATPPPPPPLSLPARLAELAIDQLHAGQGRTGLLLAIESAELERANLPADAAETPPPALALAIAAREKLAPLALRTATSKAALFCNEARGVIARTGASELTAWPQQHSSPRRLTGITFDDLASAAIDPECRRAVIQNNDFNLELRALSGSAANTELIGHEAQITSAAFNASGTAIVTASQDSTARLWDARTGRQRAVLSGHDWHVVDARFSPDGKSIVTASADQTARLWNAATGELLGVLSGHQGSVTSARFNTDSSLVVTTSWDGFVRLFDSKTLNLVLVVKHASGNLDTAQLNRDGDRLATISAEGETQLWELAAGKPARQVATFPGNARSIAFTPDGRWLAIHNWHGHLTLIDATSGSPGLSLAGDKLNIHAFAFANGSRSISAITASGVHYTWPLLTTAGEALEYAKSMAPDCLTADERTLLGLDAALPEWCSTLKPRGAALPQ